MGPDNVDRLCKNVDNQRNYVDNPSDAVHGQALGVIKNGGESAD